MITRKLILLPALTLLSACSLVGIHFKIHNPKRAGKYPAKTEERLLLGDQQSRYRTCIDAYYYKLDVDFGPVDEKTGITGSVTMHARATSDFDTLQVDMAEHLKPGNLAVTLPRTQEEVALKSWYRRSNALFLVMPQRVRRGDDIRVRIDYSGKPPEAKRPPWRGGFVRKKDRNAKPWWGVACQSEGASIWWPCKDVTNDEPDSLRMKYTVPDSLVAVGNGKLERQETRGGKSTYTWVVRNRINLYDVTFYIGDLVLVQDEFASAVTGK
jgi:aminopeptidase N